MSAFVVWALTFIPGWLLVRFLDRRAGALWDEYVLNLHRLGYAHSVETWLDGQLVGGLYGVAVGGAFFGESMFLEPSADREAQRTFDFALTNAMGDYVEINVPQVLAAVLWLRCLHGCDPEASVSELRGQLSRVFEAQAHP